MIDCKVSLSWVINIVFIQKMYWTLGSLSLSLFALKVKWFAVLFHPCKTYTTNEIEWENLNKLKALCGIMSWFEWNYFAPPPPKRRKTSENLRLIYFDKLKVEVILYRGRGYCSLLQWPLRLLCVWMITKCPLFEDYQNKFIHKSTL